MGRKKKFAITASAFAAIFTTIYVVKRYRKAKELADLTPEQRREVLKALKLARHKHILEKLEEEASRVSDDELDISWWRTAIRHWIERSDSG